MSGEGEGERCLCCVLCAADQPSEILIGQPPPDVHYLQDQAQCLPQHFVERLSIQANAVLLQSLFE